ncbi:cellulase family glycosylhydrolase [Halorussus halobius]|uniref:cellulase family glycosylhydrolase n=1 Tax=Halorussus halobius TaxID=1710537 RepID=UPI00143DFF70|nr:cellulase family glycosylhydrolase [Halorussus halobius]
MGTSTPTTSSPDAEFELEQPTAPDDVAPGDSFEIRTRIRNTGTSAGSRTVSLEIGEHEYSKSIDLGPGETTTLSFAVEEPLVADTYQFTIATKATGRAVRGELQVGGDIPTLDHFVRTEGRNFVRDGDPFYFNGANNDMLRRAPKWYVDEVFAEASELGLTALRTWVYAGKCFVGSCKGNNNKVLPEPADDGSDAVDSLPPLNETVMRKLDYAIYKANETGVRLVLPLLSNTDSHTGITDFVHYTASASNHDDFYTDPNCRALYKEYVEAVLTRVNVFTGREYRNDPGIMLWELVNEPDLLDNDGATSIMQDWIEEMAPFIKSVDDNHLLSTGEIGYYEESKEKSLPGKSDQGMDFVENHQPDAIDAATFHMYLNKNGLLAEDDDGVPRWKTWVENHAIDAHETLEKPVYAGEVAPSNDDGQFRVDRRDDDWKSQDEKRAKKYREIFDEFLAHDVNGALNWTFMIPFDYATDPVDSPEEWNASVSVYPDDPYTSEVLGEYSATLQSMSSDSSGE